MRVAAVTGAPASTGALPRRSDPRPAPVLHIEFTKREISPLRAVSEQGISLWKLWNA